MEFPVKLTGKNQNILVLKRVTYGNSKTPINQREYKSDAWGSPVGTKKEWVAWTKGKKLKLVFKETPKIKIFVGES